VILRVGFSRVDTVGAIDEPVARLVCHKPCLRRVVAQSAAGGEVDLPADRTLVRASVHVHSQRASRCSI